jgi:DNA-directed RNA polymerase
LKVEELSFELSQSKYK